MNAEALLTSDADSMGVLVPFDLFANVTLHRNELTHCHSRFVDNFCQIMVIRPLPFRLLGFLRLNNPIDGGKRETRITEMRELSESTVGMRAIR